MKKLFIIGNGFDLQHGIKSRYEDFHNFLRSIYMNEELKMKSLDDFSPWRYNIPRTRTLLGHYDDDQLIDVLGFLDYCLTKSENGTNLFNYYVNSDWWSIESTLSKLNLVEFFEEDQDINFLDYPEEYKVYDIAECFKYLNTIVSMWAKEIDISFVKPIPTFEELFDCENDLFFTFNYTRTLEEVYGAKQVRHVHGQSGQYVLFGHEATFNTIDFCAKNNIPNCCEHAVKVLLEITQKDTAKNSKKMELYYLFLDKDITDIYSYGFSFANVDLIYIKDICKSLDTSKIIWHLSNFDSKEKIVEFKEKIIECGFKGDFTTFNINNPSTNVKTNKSSYEEYLDKQRKYLGKAGFEIRQFILDYYTIGYEHPNGYKRSNSVLLMIPRLIKIIILSCIEMISNLFKNKH